MERIDKLDAARRQLKTAIRLFFQDGDSVSIHTLTEAARGLLQDLLEAQGKTSPLREVERDWVKPDRWNEYLAIMNRPRNFFKHANRDPDEVLEFRSRSTVFWLFECAALYQQLTARLLWEGFVFLVWFGLSYPDVLKKGMPLADMIRALKTQMGANLTKQGFLDVLDSGVKLPNMD